MKRSDINFLVRKASACFAAHGWTLPPNPRWDVTDLGLGDWRSHGLVLVNLAEQPEYCEKLMYAMRGMVTPTHSHKRKKEDIISRWGGLSVCIWPSNEAGLPLQDGIDCSIQINGEYLSVVTGQPILLTAGERITLTPGVWHSFVPITEECIIGEVSTANDDLHDNFFVNPDIGRFPEIEEDEEPFVWLLSES